MFHTKSTYITFLAISLIVITTVACQPKQQEAKPNPDTIQKVRYRSNSETTDQTDPSVNPLSEASHENIDAIIRKYVDNGTFSGNVLVSHAGQVIHNQSYGKANLSSGTMNNNQTKFAIASLTKPFTAMAIMQLQEKGQLQESDKVSKYLPDYAHADQITIHQLLTHTSGIASNTTFEPYWNQPLSSTPGTKYAYSNSNYLLLQKIIESVSKQPYLTFLKENIFSPLGMTHTGYSNTMKDVDQAATGYQKNQSGSPQAYYVSGLDLGGAGGLYSTVGDLYKWGEGIRLNQLVQENTKNKIFTPDAIPLQTLKDSGYGYGWMIANDKSWARHQGTIGGFQSFMTLHFQHDFTIILLSNYRYAPVADINQEISDILIEEE
ncbi:beta-lactamase family protein [Hazenella sp. IB182357]|uniref:Beta-lactamase family protein n=1 Tax=Polycladospora coralii TaxID=2771432 RepID=A0A926RUS6_9BACL|nr:serine hydrolase domain-containing protein [Polycladospora coralii]MBD1372947.1 beta-lactamase family protein [Polycladospora coralii]